MNDRTVPPLPPASQLPVNRPAAGICGRDREFLPAAIEILETPAPPLSVVTMLTICAFFAAALAWSFYGRLDVHAVAPGKIDTAGHAKVLQPLDSGKIAQDLPPAGFGDRVECVRSGARSCHDRTIHAHIGICQVCFYLAATRG